MVTMTPTQWGVEVRLIQQKAYNETVALTDYAEASNGEAQFSVDLSDVGASSIRIAAEAVLTVLLKVTTEQSCLSDLPF
ncbi:hypothetical protein PCI56_05600 [Plesiomonas shigelloides subsp. oncorhynchi]|nr:hypothetical protein [Plesiomonas shigelloides]